MSGGGTAPPPPPAPMLGVIAAALALLVPAHVARMRVAFASYASLDGPTPLERPD
jgi:hypothetical protein